MLILGENNVSLPMLLNKRSRQKYFRVDVAAILTFQVHELWRRFLRIVTSEDKGPFLMTPVICIKHVRFPSFLLNSSPFLIYRFPFPLNWHIDVCSIEYIQGEECMSLPPFTKVIVTQLWKSVHWKLLCCWALHVSLRYIVIWGRLSCCLASHETKQYVTETICHRNIS